MALTGRQEKKLGLEFKDWRPADIQSIKAPVMVIKRGVHQDKEATPHYVMVSVDAGNWVRCMRLPMLVLVSK
jgi:hypothetical protein